MAGSPVLDYPTLPVTRDFHRIPLRPGIQFEGLAGYRDRAWLLADDKIYEHDGKQIVRELKLCSGAVKEGQYARYILKETALGPVVLGSGTRNEDIIGDLRTPGSMVCRQMNTSDWSTMVVALTVLPTALGVGVPFDARTSLGIVLPRPPSDLPARPAFFFAPRRDSLWLQLVPIQDDIDYVTFHFDGTAWRRVPTPPAPPFGSMWAGPDGVIWATASFSPVTFGNTGPHKFDLEKYDGKKWTLVPVPEGFLPRWITGTDSKDVWFIQGSHAFQWDGANWRVREFARRTPGAPYADVVGEPFMDDSGSLWLLANTEDGWKILRTDPK